MGKLNKMFQESTGINTLDVEKMIADATDKKKAVEKIMWMIGRQVTVNGVAGRVDDSKDGISTLVNLISEESGVDLSEMGVPVIVGEDGEVVDETALDRFLDKLSKLDKIVIDEDLDVVSHIVVDKKLDLTVNADMTNSLDLWTDSFFSIITVDKGGELTLDGTGTISAKKDDCYAVTVKEGAKLIIKGGKYVGNISTVYITGTGGEVVIEGGEFDLKQLANKGNGYQFLINCKDEAYESGLAKVTIKGGKFHNFDPSNNGAETVEPTNFLAEGYHVEADGEWFIVKEGAAVPELDETSGEAETEA